MTYIPLDIRRIHPDERPQPCTEEETAEAEYRLIRSGQGAHLFVVDGSRFYDVDEALAVEIDACLSAAGVGGRDRMRKLAATWGLATAAKAERKIDGTPLSPPPLYSLSLNVAQACNMRCHYCYADSGAFGGRPRLMRLEVAEASVERLIAESDPGATLVLGFMGGEPLLNREVVHAITHYGARRAQESGREMRFSMTTNATLLTSDDIRLFTTYPFSVQVSIDGDRGCNDAQRPMQDGAGSYDRIVSAVERIKSEGRPQLLAARVTVTPTTGELLPILEHLIHLGFDDVGFSAVVVSPNPDQAFAPDHFALFLQRMILCGKKALAELSARRAYPFGNFLTAMQEIHRGTHRPYPCGAGAAYLSVNAEGALFACHRFIDDPKYAMGNVQSGSDLERRAAHLARSHVDRQLPCRRCWARYLCGGGCYHEVERRGRIGCDYIRGWLDFCLHAYAELTMIRPDFFSGPLGADQREQDFPAAVIHQP